MSRHRSFCCDLVGLIAEKTLDAGNLTLTSAQPAIIESN
jgi:hypothetical protein